MKSEILVTGATGFIGSHLAIALLNSGQPVRLLVREKKRLPPALLTSAEIFYGDLLCPETLADATRNVKLVYHCAANVETWGNWESYYQPNVVGLDNLLKVINDGNKQLPRFNHISSVDVYGFPNLACTETTPLSDHGFYYGKSKILAENLLKSYGQNTGLPYTIIRPCNVIGPGSQFIERIGKELTKGVMMTIDKGKCHAGLIYIDNLVNSILALTDHLETIGEIYNIRDTYEISWAVFLKDFKQRIKGRGKIVDLPYSFAEILCWLFERSYKMLSIKKEPLLHHLLINIFGRTCGHSPQKIVDACGDITSVSYEEALERSSQWFLEHFRKETNPN